jgi:hypothetical protein
MRKSSMLYFSAIAVVGVIPVFGVMVTPYSEISLALVALVAFAILTFPLGFAAFPVVLPLAYYGIATPDETIFIMMPLCAFLGYVQWARLLPALYRRQR